MIGTIELVVKNFPTSKIPGPDGFTGKFNPIFKEEMIEVLHKLFRKQKNSSLLIHFGGCHNLYIKI